MCVRGTEIAPVRMIGLSKIDHNTGLVNCGENLLAGPRRCVGSILIDFCAGAARSDPRLGLSWRRPCRHHIRLNKALLYIWDSLLITDHRLTEFRRASVTESSVALPPVKVRGEIEWLRCLLVSPPAVAAGFWGAPVAGVVRNPRAGATTCRKPVIALAGVRYGSKFFHAGREALWHLLTLSGY
jgi:hypothetical protein